MVKWLELGGTLKIIWFPTPLLWAGTQFIRGDCSKACSRDKASTTSLFSLVCI